MSTNEFLEEVWPQLPRLERCARRCGARDPDDLVQETIMRALVARGRYRPGSNCGAWLCRILTNLAINEKRRRAREERLRIRLAWVERTPVPSALGEYQELRAAWSRLTAHEQHLLHWADVEKRSYAEIAKGLGCPMGTVMSRLFRARRKLRAEVTSGAAPARARRASGRAAGGSAVAAPAP